MPKIKFHENPSSGSRVVPYGRTDGRKEERTDTTKLTCSFYKCTNAPKIEEMGQLNTGSPIHVNLLMLLAITFIP